MMLSTIRPYPFIQPFKIGLVLKNCYFFVHLSVLELFYILQICFVSTNFLFLISISIVIIF